MKKTELQAIIKEELRKVLSEAQRKFEVDDKVKVVTPSMSHSGKTGTVIDMSPSESFFLVKFGSGQNAYFHEADLKLIKRPSIG
jgi:hypothetical protein